MPATPPAAADAALFVAPTAAPAAAPARPRAAFPAAPATNDAADSDAFATRSDASRRSRSRFFSAAAAAAAARAFSRCASPKVRLYSSISSRPMRPWLKSAFALRSPSSSGVRPSTAVVISPGATSSTATSSTIGGGAAFLPPRSPPRRSSGLSETATPQRGAARGANALALASSAAANTQDLRQSIIAMASCYSNEVSQSRCRPHIDSL